MHRRLALRALGWIALAALLAPGVRYAMASDKRWRSTLLRDHPLTGKIWHAAAGRFASADELAGTLRQAYFRLLGEVHDNPDHHAIQAELLVAIGAGGLKPVVAFEQFDLEYDAALQQRQQDGKLDAEAIADAVNFNRKGWTWDYYRPLVETALRYGMPLRAANLSRTAAGQIAKQGLAALAPERIAAMRLDATWSTEKELVLREIIIEGHCSALPASMVPAMTAAQRARDATLARSLMNAGQDGAVLITGNGHVRHDLAVPLYLRAAVAGVTVCAVGIVEVEAGADEPRDYLKTATAGALPFDFVWFTPRWERPDPCAAFRSSPAGNTERQ
jgi:uncharacterized iron-regulated protein